MANTVTLLGTSQTAIPERPQIWTNGQTEYGAVGRLKLCRIEVTRHRVGTPLDWSPGSRHPAVKVVMQIFGTSIFEQDGECLAVAPGNAIAYDLSRPHCLVNPSRTTQLVVIVPKELALRHGFPALPVMAQPFSTREGVGRLAFDLVNSTFIELPAISRGCRNELAQTILNLLFLPLPARPTSRAVPAPGNGLPRQIKVFIDANLHDPDLSIDSIAAALNCSKRYLHMAFAGEGTTIARYMWSVRLDHCRRDLETSPQSTITEIAFSWGFNSSSHFSRLFKERYGFSPSRLLHSADRRAG